MLRRTFLTLATAACLFVLYELYAQFVGSLVQPPDAILEARQALAHQSDTKGPPIENADIARKYLPDWAADAKYQLRDRSGVFYYTEQWERMGIGGGEAVRFRPFAVVWFRDTGDDVATGQAHAAPAPIVLTADSALFQFNSKFDVASTDFGRVVGGKLEGPFHIQGKNGLSVRGRNLIFQEAASRIWSDHPVEFAYGPHHGKADLGVQLELIPRDNSDDENALAFVGVRKVRMRRHVSMNLVKDGKTKPIPVQIACDGGFEYELQSHIARFEDNVSVRQSTGPDQVDSLACSLMTLLFENRAPGSPAGADSAISETMRQTDAADGPAVTPGLLPADGRRSRVESVTELPSNLQFRRLLAEGRDVVLRSDANELVAHMNEFLYDAVSQVAVIRSSETANVWHRGSTLRCPEISVTHDEQGQLVSAWCRGAGQLNHRDPQTGDLVLQADWGKELRKYPDPDSDMDIIKMEEDVVVRNPEQRMQVAADLIRLWYSAKKKQNLSETDSESASGLDTDQPRHLIASGHVAVASPQLAGETQRLELTFDTASSEQHAATARMSSSSSGGHLSLSGGQPPPRPLPVGVNRGGPGIKAEDSPLELPLVKQAGNDRPVHVASDAIRVRMERQDNDREFPFHVAEVWNEGNVHLNREQVVGQEGFDLAGNRLHLINASPNQQIFHIFGDPARIQSQGYELEGPEVYLDRFRNESWVEGAGTLRLPVHNGLEGQHLTQARLLNIDWDEKMTFDGRQADFLGQVHAELDGSHMRCHDMQVTLTTPISFSDDKTEQNDTNIRRVVCRDGVEVDSYEYVDGQLSQIRRAWFGQFTLDQTTGATEAMGPGEMQLWRRGTQAALAPTAVAQANAPLEADRVDWQYTQIQFSGNSQGNVHQRQTTFHDRVRLVHGPVAGSHNIIDADTLPKDAATMQCDTLEFAQQVASGTHNPGEFIAPNGSIQLTARGNANLEGRTFYGTFFARSDVISFDQSKGLFVLSTLGNREATLWRQKTDAGEYSEASAKSMRFIPTRDYLDFDRTTHLQGLE